MKNILLLVHDDAGQEARLQAALDITRAIGGHLHCLDVTLMPRMMDTPYDGVGAALVFQDEREREGRNKTRLQERLVREDVPWNWTDRIGDFDTALKEAAAFADLIVVNRELGATAYPNMRATAEEMILHAGRPVIAVPDEARRFDVAGHALVAWDGSGPASAALMAAVPLLKQAEKVTILQIGEDTGETSAEDAAAYLARHGIEARIAREDDKGQATAQALLAAVAAHRPSYVVMGGYGHSRIGESLWGGASRAMLKESPVPVFMAR